MIHFYRKNNPAFSHTGPFLPCDDVTVIFLDVALWSYHKFCSRFPGSVAKVRGKG